jgi:uncharacterized protein (TIGR00369 family)
MIEASFGSATYVLPATDWMLGPKGVVHSGLLAFLADGALIATVVSALPPRVLCTTAELSMTFLGTPPLAGGDIAARGELVHLDHEMGLAQVFVRDAHDRLVAHGTSRCSVFPPIADSIELPVPPGSPRNPSSIPPIPICDLCRLSIANGRRKTATASTGCEVGCVARCRVRRSTS